MNQDSEFPFESARRVLPEESQGSKENQEFRAAIAELH
jgi:hypothetical protein